jgi:hypothetical protein
MMRQSGVLMRFLAIAYAIIFSTTVLANKSLDNFDSLFSDNDYEPMIFSERLLENVGMNAMPLTKEQKRKRFRANLEKKNENSVRKSIELLRIQNKIEIMYNMENATNRVLPKPRKAFIHKHLTK